MQNETSETANNNATQIIPPKGLKRHIAFVFRCTISSVITYLLATFIGLPFPVWAVVSAIIVTQETLDSTKHAVIFRILGTATGVVVAVIVGTILNLFHANTAIELGVAVAACATIVRILPNTRVAMWTAALVFLTQTPEISLYQAGFWRGAETLLGGIVGAAMHFISEFAVRSANKATAKPHSITKHVINPHDE